MYVCWNYNDKVCEVILDKNRKIRFNMWLQSGAYEELKRLAMFEGRSVSDIIRVLIND